MKDLTLCFIINGDRVLLGKKKRGFGVGRFNGFGGKVETGETIEQAAVREMREEAGVSLETTDLISHGSIQFHFDDNPDTILHVHIFRAETWFGEPKESEEMAPQWFSANELPFTEMWISDTHWLPQILSGKKVSGTCHFTSFTHQGGELRDVNLFFQ